MKSTADDFFFHFEVNPFHQAINVDSTTRAWAFTRIEKVAFFFIFLFKANLARVMLYILVLGWIELHDFTAQFAFGGGRWLDMTVVRNLTDVVLNSAQFDGLAGHEFVTFWFSVGVFDFSDDEVSFFGPWNVAFNWWIGFDSVRLNFLFGQLVFVNKVNFDFRVVWFHFLLNLEFCQQLIFFVIEGILFILAGNNLLGWIREMNTLFSPVNWDSLSGEGEGKVFDMDFVGLEIEEWMGIFVPSGRPDTDDGLALCLVCFHL